MYTKRDASGLRVNNCNIMSVVIIILLHILIQMIGGQQKVKIHKTQKHLHLRLANMSVCILRIVPYTQSITSRKTKRFVLEKNISRQQYDSILCNDCMCIVVIIFANICLYT